MIQRVLLAGLLAGAIAGAASFALQAAFITPMIQAAERYQSAPAGGHPGPALPAASERTVEDGSPADTGHRRRGWQPEDGLERTAYTLAADLGIGIGFALLLAGVMTVRRDGGWRRGLVWGCAGFAVFHLAPTMGLPPKLPGMASAPLWACQLWWLETATATAAGLFCALFGRFTVLRVLGIALIALPHVIGAPQPDMPGLPMPALMVGRYVAQTLGVAALFWVLLGGLTGHLLARRRG